MDRIKAGHWRDVPASAWRWPNFSAEEMACRHCGAIDVSARALDRLQALRDKIGRPFIINSAYRCPAHNKAVGGAKASRHMAGDAFDVSMSNHDPHRFKAEADAAGFVGIGTYPPKGGRHNFIHIDTRPGAPARWGDPFPPSDTRFTEEPEAQPGKAAAKDSAITIGTIAVAHEAAKAALPEIAPAFPEHWVSYLAAVLAVVGIFIAFMRARRSEREDDG